MLTFINSAILIALPAIVIPILIHLFNKQRKKRIEFSSTIFLKMLEKQRLKRLKLYQYLLILTRTLVILILVLAFARPTMTQQITFLDNKARTTAVIILDNGVNMRRYDESGQRFIRAKDKARKIINQFAKDDNIFLLSSSNPNDLLDPQTSLENLECSYTYSNWESCLEQAKMHFEEKQNYNLELYIISDLQFKNTTFLTSLNDMQDIRKYLIQIMSGITKNVSIDSIDIKTTIFELNKSVLIDIFLRNDTQEVIKDLELNLFILDQRISHQTLDLKPLEKKVESLTLQPKKYGHLDGYVEINDDDLIADNRYYFSLNVPNEISLLFVNDSPISFLNAAISSIQDNTNLTFTREKFTSWGRQNFNQFDIMILVNFSQITNINQERLRNFLGKGGTIILLPGERTNIRELNKLLSFLNCKINVEFITNSKSRQDFFTVKRININHPLFSGLFIDKNPDFIKPRFYRYFKVKSEFSGDNILSFNNNEPFIIHDIIEPGAIIFITSYIENGWTDLQFRGIFIPLFLRIFYLASSNSLKSQKSYASGSDISFVLNREFGPDEYQIVSSNGEKYRIVPEVMTDNLLFQLNQLKHPDNYKLMQGNTHITTLSVNSNTRALMPPYLDLTNSLKEMDNIMVFNENQDLEQIIIESRFGYELWYLLVILAFMVFLLEILLVKRIEGKNSSLF